MKVLTSAVAWESVKQLQGCQPKSSERMPGLGAGIATTAEAAASETRMDLSCMVKRVENKVEILYE
jgi:hypothetical protein